MNVVSILGPRRLIYLIFLLMVHPAVAQQQGPPFWDEIQRFDEQDRRQMPAKGAIVFVGSSSIRMWTGLEQSFPDREVLNRGFGGSTLPDVIRYADRIIFRYAPRQVVIYCGENDIASGAPADSAYQRFRTLHDMIVSHDRKTKIVFISMKPSPSRAHLGAELKKANDMIHAYLARNKRAAYADVYSLMLDENGQPRGELFLSDRLHMNEKGYAIWTDVIAPFLVRN